MDTISSLQRSLERTSKESEASAGRQSEVGGPLSQPACRCIPLSQAMIRLPFGMHSNPCPCMRNRHAKGMLGAQTQLGRLWVR